MNNKQPYGVELWRNYPFNWPEFFEWRKEEQVANDLLDETLKQFGRK